MDKGGVRICGIPVHQDREAGTLVGVEAGVEVVVGGWRDLLSV